MKITHFLIVILIFGHFGLVTEAKSKNGDKENTRFGDIETEVTQSRHQLKTEKGTIQYTSHTGYLTIKNQSGDEMGKFFFIAYTKEGVDNPANRPITFAFNGGPGSASVYLHLGALGPKRVKLTPKGKAGPPPYELQKNKYTWLYKTDLVFIDPVGTGYSRAMNKEKAEKFYGYKNDIQTVSKFIHRYITHYNRWASPKFLTGESYGTTRSAGLAVHLQKKYGIHLNGLMLVSTVLNFQTLRFTKGNDLPYILFMPSYTASAWYHEQLPAKLQQLSIDSVTQKARQFAKESYQDALFAGNTIDSAQKRKIAKRYAELTGLPAKLVYKAHLRVKPHIFRKKLLDNQKKSIGRYDSRLTLKEFDQLSLQPNTDPSSDPWVKGAFNHGINDYLSRELDFTKDLKYNVFNPDVHPWKYDQNRFLNVSPQLAKVMQINPHLKVHVYQGYYDLATPFFATEYTFDHLDIPPHQKDNISASWYLSGHMMYIKASELEKFTENSFQFIENAIPGDHSSN